MTTRDKQQVARQFSRAAASYDSAAGVQHRAVTQLLEMPSLAAIEGHWCDIGCGTGTALPHLKHRGAKQLTGIDMAEGMLKAASQHQDQNTQLLLADADALPIDNNSVNGLFSSLMLQWSENPQHTLQEWQRTLKPRGTLAIATLLPGTQHELKQAWQAIDNHPHVNEFTTQETIIKALKTSGFTNIVLHQECLTEYYDSIQALLRGLKNIGATNVNQGRRTGLGGRDALRQLAAHYPIDSDGRFPLSYEVLWITAVAT
jgi:malonyl-CoA O-methyltransferase